METAQNLTLKEAIRRTRLSVEIDERMVVIARKEMEDTVTTGGMPSSIGNYAANKLLGSHEDESNLGYEAKFWKDKCSVLYQEKKAVESTYLLKLQEILHRYESLRDYSKMMERKIDEMSVSTNDSSLQDSDKEKLALFESMTGMSIDVRKALAPTEPSADISNFTSKSDPTINTAAEAEEVTVEEYICTLKNKKDRKATRFVVKTNANAEGHMYFGPRANVHLLPEYLQSEILCEPQMGPVMLGDMLQQLFYREECDENSAQISNNMET